MPGARRRGHVHAARSDAKRPNSLPGAAPTPATSPASRTARSSAREREDDAGPTNNWRDPAEMRATLHELFAGCDARPHDVRRAVLDGPARLADRPHRRELTDSPYVARQHADHDPHGPGRARRARRRRRLRAVRALGRRAARPTAQADVPWPCNADDKYIVHFPETREIWSLRLGLRRQRAARQEVLRAAHRLGDGPRRGLARRAHADPQADLARRARSSTSPARSRRACGKTNLAMLHPDAPGLEGRDGRRRHRAG